MRQQNLKKFKKKIKKNNKIEIPLKNVNCLERNLPAMFASSAQPFRKFLAKSLAKIRFIEAFGWTQAEQKSPAIDIQLVIFQYWQYYVKS